MPEVYCNSLALEASIGDIETAALIFRAPVPDYTMLFASIFDRDVFRRYLAFVRGELRWHREGGPANAVFPPLPYRESRVTRDGALRVRFLTRGNPEIFCHALSMAASTGYLEMHSYRRHPRHARWSDWYGGYPSDSLPATPQRTLSDFGLPARLIPKPRGYRAMRLS